MPPAASITSFTFTPIGTSFNTTTLPLPPFSFPLTVIFFETIGRPSSIASYTRRTVSTFITTAFASNGRAVTGRRMPKVSRITALSSPIGYISGSK